jgi:hypothetical protein
MAFMQTFQTILITVPNYETVKPYFLELYGYRIDEV